MITEQKSPIITIDFQRSVLSIPIFNQFYEVFYQLKRKVVPADIKNLLINPLSLAVWYMDDGFRRRDCNGVYLCTSAFTNDEQILLIESLKMNFGLEARVHYAAGNARIYIPVSSAKKFCQLISEFIVPDLPYKLIL